LVDFFLVFFIFFLSIDLILKQAPVHPYAPLSKVLVKSGPGFSSPQNYFVRLPTSDDFRVTSKLPILDCQLWTIERQLTFFSSTEKIEV